MFSFSTGVILILISDEDVQSALYKTQSMFLQYPRRYRSSASKSQGPKGRNRRNEKVWDFRKSKATATKEPDEG